MTPGFAPILPRLAKLLPLLGSDHAGEVAATAAAIGRLLGTVGASWHDLAERLSAPVMPPPAWNAADFAEAYRRKRPARPSPPPRQPAPPSARAGGRRFTRIWEALDFILATDTMITAEEGERLQRLREQDYGKPHVAFAQDDIAWLAMRWHLRVGGRA